MGNKGGRKLTRVALFILLLFSSTSNGRVQSWRYSYNARQLLATSSAPVLAAPSPIDAKEVKEGGNENHLNKEFIIAITLSALAVAIIALSAIFACVSWRRNLKANRSKNIQPSGLSLVPVFNKLSSLKILNKRDCITMMDYSILELATNNFNENNVLGEGRFGFVYKARFDGDSLAAVRKLDVSRPENERMFNNELNLFGRIRHQNIVSLLGYCIRGDSRFLVYDFLSNGSLKSVLYGPSHGSELTWHLRMKIALDTARGLEYLHECCNPPVIHRALNSANILLDAKYNAKISDFGLAVSGLNQNKTCTKLSDTSGYVAPEYILDGKLTEKSDVYAFGVVLLELMLRRKPIEKTAPSIVTWAMPQLTDRSKLPGIVDPVIQDTMDLKHLYQVAAVAVLCVQEEASYRPLITDVLHSLIPLVPVELGGALRVAERLPHVN